MVVCINYDICTLNIVGSPSYFQENIIFVFLFYFSFWWKGVKLNVSKMMEAFSDIILYASFWHTAHFKRISPTQGHGSSWAVDNIREQQHPKRTFVWITQRQFIKVPPLGHMDLWFFFGTSDLNHKSSKYFYSASSVSAACPVALSTVFEAFFFFFFCAFRLAELCSKALSSGSSTSNSDL